MIFRASLKIILSTILNIFSQRKGDNSGRLYKCLFSGCRKLTADPRGYCCRQHEGLDRKQRQKDQLKTASKGLRRKLRKANAKRRKKKLEQRKLEINS